jgi:hypothetical protein
MASRLWIGGATDAGKTTQARRLALMHTLALYECDRTDAAQHGQLAATSPAWRAFVDEGLEERWVQPTPEVLCHRSLASFAARLPLVLEDLDALERRGRPVLAEGFCLTPNLVAPLLDDPRRAIWLLPSEAFKRAAWERRGKPSWRDKVSDPERGARNLFERDLLLAAEIARQAKAHGFEVMLVDGALSEDEVNARLEARFAPFLDSD